MPWCEDCDRFLTPTSMGADGSCPSCGRVLDVTATTSSVATDDDDRPPWKPDKAPWHFKLMVVAVCIYLGWRLIQGLDWLVHAF